MGVASNETIEFIIKKNKQEIEEVKKIIESKEKTEPNNCITIIFKLMNGKSICVQCFKNTKLFHVFLLLIDKAKDSNYTNLDKLKIYYNSVDITTHFSKESNKDISFLNLSSFNPIIYINV